jgi:Icc-related predicted phosphoesterase
MKKEQAMTVVGISDIHGKVDFLEKLSLHLKNADLIVVSGDLTHFGKEKQAAAVFRAIKSVNKNFLAVPGNCDYPSVHMFLNREEVNLHGRIKTFEDYTVVGVGGSLKCPGLTPNEYTEEEFKLILDEIKKELPRDRPVILVTHHPPAGTECDLVGDDRHVGSNSIREFILDVQPAICFSGHIHESRGIGTIGKTKVVNPGPLMEGSYVIVQLTGDVESIKIMVNEQCVHRYP